MRLKCVEEHTCRVARGTDKANVPLETFFMTPASGIRGGSTIMVRLRLRKTARVELLRTIDLFKGCSIGELGGIASLTTEHEAQPGRVLTKRGEPGLEAFVIVDGEAEVTRKGVSLATLGPGSLFGELALLDGGQRTATVTAASDMRLLVLARHEFLKVLDDCPAVGRKIIGQLGERVRKTDEMLDAAPALSGTIGAWSL
jgi:CRP/FNR family transcriptional regulator, cyclic AMP receptor protein